MNSWEALSEIRRRVGEEEGVLRSPAALRVALCHPASYAVAMSSLGFQAIYREIHLHPGAAAERAFLPDRPAEYRKNRLPVFTYEGERPLSEYAVVAFSIAWELEITGLFEMLDLCGIPLLRGERGARHPLIVAGGPLTRSNPAILAPFADLIVLGEGEETVHDLLDAAAVMNREEMLGHLSGRPGFHVPGISSGFGPPGRVDDARLPASSQILTPNAVLRSMFLIEPERGCSRTCRYCVMRCGAGGGMRVVSADRVWAKIPEAARRVGLVGAAVTDHPEIRSLIRRIVASGREVGISSLRADRLDPELVGLLARGGYRTLTTAADGASQRMRDLAGRNLDEGHLLRAAELARGAGIERLRLYMMIGFPGETDDDIGEMIRFCGELSRVLPLSLSVSPFVAKKHTPLDGAPFEDLRLLDRRLAAIRAGLKGKADVRPGSTRWAWVEYALSQGTEEAGLAALDAWRGGGGIGAWRKSFAARGCTLLRS
jgi:radical SAM superfamily enzyme YgiQ (UPF0313 family)